MVESGAAEPLTLTEALVAQRHALPDVKVLLGYTLTDTIRPEHLDELSVTVFGGYGRNAALAAAGAEVLPVHVSSMSALVSSGALRVDVLMLQAAPPVEEGTDLNLGATTDVLLEAARSARAVICEINDRVPRTRGDTLLPAGLVTHRIHTSRPLPELSIPPPGDAERSIAASVAALVPNGAVIQVGVGRVPDAAVRALHGHRNLGIHSGYVGDWLPDLVESGAVTNRDKQVDEGISVGGTLMGSQRLYTWADGNASLEMHSARYTHAPDVLARHPCLVTINSAIEVDLTGQVNTETIDGRYAGAIGGAADFARAGTTSPHGLSIIALTSTATRGTRSRIVPALSSGATLGRADVDVVVTEYGVATLTGVPLKERAHRLASVSAPGFRDALREAVRSW
jgi:acyl-CoA hydrolase